MSPAQVAAKLQHFNDWRRGHHDDTAQPDPREIGEAIDAAIEMIERMRNWIHEEGDRNDVCTYNILGEVCGYCECECKRKEKSK